MKNREFRMILCSKDYRKMDGYEAYTLHYQECSAYDNKILMGASLSFPVKQKDFEAANIGDILRIDSGYPFEQMDVR